MATFPVYADVSYLDAAERISVVSYRLETALEDDGSNMDDVLTNATALEVALNILTWDHIQDVSIRVITGGGGAAANVAANNQVHARSYGVDAAGDPMSFDVAAWDDTTFDQDEFNLLSAAYNTAAAAVAALIANPETGSPMTGAVARSVSRTHKSRGKKIS